MSDLSLVTGATGQLGSQIVEQLRQAGVRVRALARSDRNAAFLRDLGAEVVVGDLRDSSSLNRAMQGVKTVYHAAAKVSDWGAWKEFEEETTVSTRNVVAACKTANVDRLLHVSSISVYGHPKLGPGQGVNESTPLGQGFWMWDYYPRAKLLAENIAREFPRTTIVRPSWIYGPRDRVTIPRVVRALREKRVPIIGDGSNFLNLIYVGDVARGAILAATKPDGVGHAYNLCSVGEVTQRDLVDALTDALSLPRITKHVPYFLAIRFAWLQEAMAKALGSKSPPRITRRAIYLIGRPTAYRIDKAKTELGWRPEVGIQTGVSRALEWFVSLPENADLSLKMPVVTTASTRAG